VSGRNAGGHTALAAAAADDNPRLVAALLDAGAPFDGEPGVKDRRASLAGAYTRPLLSSTQAVLVAEYH